MPKIFIRAGERYDNQLSATVIKYLCLRNVTVPDLAITLRMSRPTAYDRLHNPEKFTVGELRKLITKLHIPREEIYEAIVGGDVNVAVQM